MTAPLVLEIKGNSLDDGPGIRSVVFFKGCPLSCLWCHNPESRQPGPEIAFDADACIACGTCLETCPEDALAGDNPFYVDRQKCSLCFACAAACPSKALSRVGEPMSVEAIVSAVLKDKVFFQNSGGGVTLSGGEPTRMPAFAGELLARLKSEGLHTLMETCGFFELERFQQIVYPFLDTIYFDIKLMDTAAHKRYCGVDNTPILNNFRHLFQQYQEGGVEIVPRTPLIPGITDLDDNLGAVIDFLKACGVEKAALLAYHPLWHAKNRKLGIPGHAAESGGLESFSPRQRLEACRQLFLSAGIRV